MHHRFPKTLFIAVVLATGCGADDPSHDHPVELPAQFVLHCVDPGAQIVDGNFTAITQYLSGSSISLDPSAPWTLSWQFGARAATGFQWTVSAEFPPSSAIVGAPDDVFTTQISDHETATLTLSKFPDAQTELRDSQLTLDSGSQSQSHDLSCFVTAHPERALCSQLGYPQGLFPTRKFIASFLGTPDVDHVQQVMTALRDHPAIQEVTELSSSGGVFAYAVAYAQDADPDMISRDVANRWCPLADDLRVDVDAQASLRTSSSR